MKLKIIKSVLVILLAFNYLSAKSQEKINKDPKKAALYSSILPGAGQFYTKKYWKIPIIYAGIATSLYYVIESNTKFKNYRDGYLERISGNGLVYSEYSNAQLVTLTNYHKRNREVSTLCLLGVYLINIIDASVNAHLFSYDINEDLSLILQPLYMHDTETAGILLSLNL